MSASRHVHQEWTECRHRDGQCCDACHVDYEAIAYETRIERNAKQRARYAAARGGAA